MSLLHLVNTAEPNLAAIAQYLDHLPPTARVTSIRTLSRRAQARLFDAAAGFRAIGPEHFVPADVAPVTEVVHQGKNSLPAFTHFAKAFGRDADGNVFGYNRAGGFLETVVGPGYFALTAASQAGEVVIDYTQLPETRLDGWPPIISNEARLSRVVYSGTQDVMRGISEHVSIGRASRRGKVMDAWFVLCRDIRSGV
ncbi:MAG: hypothetical protein KC417_12480 [Myxococcales bacterium]|nr:hypothetical protein [Myxococcales bacterium]